jgi:TPR repeat protein
MKQILWAMLILAVSGATARADQGWLHLEAGDLAAAESYWAPRAEDGNTEAMAGLAHIAALQGEDPTAARWQHRAAAQGHAPSQVLLASAYLEGRGVPRDPFLAYAWYHLAALNGQANAARARDLAGRWLSAEQSAEARALAARWQTDGAPDAP